MEILNFGQVSLISKICSISIAEELLGIELIPDSGRVGGWIENLSSLCFFSHKPYNICHSFAISVSEVLNEGWDAMFLK